MTNQNFSIKRALISVYDKTNLLDVAKTLLDHKVEILSTGGTARFLKENNIPVTYVSDITQFPELMNGRVKTLHPNIQAGILGKRDQHADEAVEHNIGWIDCVICNLYPFEETIQKQDCTMAQAIENIDIGGPTMIRASAKNHDWVVSLTSPAQYPAFIEAFNSGQLTQGFRQQLAAEAFAATAYYDALITDYLQTKQSPPASIGIFKQNQTLRYGENPHQQASIYKQANQTLLNEHQLSGKQLSYNNLADADGALRCLKDFDTPTAVVIKHATPCGVSTQATIAKAFEDAFNADSKSAFGSIVAINRPCDIDTARLMRPLFIEVIIAPSYTDEALELLKEKKLCRLIQYDVANYQRDYDFKQVPGGLLIQDHNHQCLNPDTLECVTGDIKSIDMDDILFAWHVVKHVKSNGIVIAHNQTTLGIGSGHVSRIDAVEQAIKKSGNIPEGAVLASDAFFPFKDNIEAIAEKGIKIIVQPGGSKRDDEVIEAAQAHGITMLFTGTRCFAH
jgi:phosphoribosylaminoimidazolecarboxamide formyltransferase/IMP cyclohydrolase